MVAKSGSRPKARSDAGAEKGRSAPLTISRPELLEGGSDRKFRELINKLFALFTTTTSIRDGYANFLGVHGPQYMILMSIRYIEDGPVYVSTIAEHTRLSASFVTVETNKLQAMGLLRKIRGAADRRTVRVSLTDRGNDLLDSIAEMRCQVNNVQFGCLTAEEFQLLVPLVQRLLESGERALALLEFLKSQNRPAHSIAGLGELVAGAIQPFKRPR
jgi:DNA-binding MarR family transcriptional regulator